MQACEDELASTISLFKQPHGGVKAGGAIRIQKMNLISSLLTNRKPILTIHQKENYIQTQPQKNSTGMKFNLASNYQIEKLLSQLRKTHQSQQ
ncbi:hypothetical protein IGS59_17205 [Janthinobacterium sp. GW460P]|uniref:hypothetical protein n=1 Tax=unclassified Janthinobacterium TaxID=2610881 RepID=UPI000A327596|nr:MULTISPECIES: hypothetical protein [unclassified Janthinobacterium]MCC7703976.1 hypothetical protein [Janthinobacterium sp. GW460P]MCC7709483.1 hypothetical protein [Janthinobacterium sp. GW460W]